MYSCSGPQQYGFLGVESQKAVAVQSMAESMTPGQEAEAKEREGMLKRIAKLAKQQGSFQLACKKYTQVCYHSRSMLCLFSPSMLHTDVVGHVRLLSGQLCYSSSSSTLLYLSRQDTAKNCIKTCLLGIEFMLYSLAQSRLPKRQPRLLQLFTPSYGVIHVLTSRCVNTTQYDYRQERR